MSEMNSKVAFVIVGWNNKNLLMECFESVRGQTHKNTGIIYVDNASTDGSADWVKSEFPDARVIELKKNTGFAKGNNVGIEEALKDPATEFVGMLNTDARLEPEWVERIVQFASHKPHGACYQGTTLDYSNHGIIDSTHIFTSRNGQGTQGNWRYYYVKEIGPKKVFGVNAAACLISRKFIEAQPFGAKLFDETMFMYLEDVDLATRATVMGWDNYLVPGARAYHMGSASARSRSSTFSLYMTFRNNSGMIFKNFPMKIIWKMLPKLIKGDIDTIRTLWRTDRKPHIWAVIKGRAVGVLRSALFVGKRLKLSKQRNIDSEYLWLLMRRGC